MKTWKIVLNDHMNKHSNQKVVSRTLFSLFTKYSAKPFILVSGEGNYGDHLIYRGAQKLAKNAGIRYKCVGHDEFMKNDYPSEVVVYISGSGGFIKYWQGGAMDELVKAINTHKGIVILGPTTVEDSEEFLNQAIIGKFRQNHPQRVILFAREMTSFTAIKKYFPGWMELFVDHDTAFNLSIEDFPIKFKKKQYILYSFREDVEKKDNGSARYHFVQFDPVLRCADLEEWLTVHAEAKAIVTDRLHSSVVGSLFGVPTTLLPNSYHKNRSVWEYSLKDLGVNWLDSPPLNSFSQLFGKYKILRDITNSFKVNQFIRKINGIKASR